MIRVLGLAILVAGLFLVGVSGDNHRVPNLRHMGWGAFLMLSGMVVAIFAGAIGIATGWDRP